MINKIVIEHIQEMYPNWLKKSKIYCKKYGLIGEAYDLLQEILLDILSKDPDKLLELTQKQENNYQALDCYILNILRTNAKSDSAPYRQRYIKHIFPIDSNIDPLDLEVIEEPITDELYQKIQEIYQHLDLPAQERKIFEFYYFENKKFKEWPGPEGLGTLYKICRFIIQKIKNEIKKINLK